MSDTEPTTPEEWIQVRVTSVRAASSTVSSFRFVDANGGTLPPWEPGAHIDLDIPGHEV